MKSIPKAYEAKIFEDNIYTSWEKSGLFKAVIDKDREPFVISMPPPNATGTLHLGHATMLALEDMMIRYKRMQGYVALWLPGTDHASIATQNKVEKDLREEGLSRHDLGRKDFLQRVSEFVLNSQDTIRNQIRKMGASCDWSRERYTLDTGLSRAVTEAFVRMFEDGLIYRGDRIVNWCPRCSSTLADDEVEYIEEKSKFYYLRYGPVVIGTARPETKFLDKVIVVHPKDKRYLKYVGKEMEVEWIEGKIKARFLADPSADPQLGTGAMTITPAHDFIDFEIAKRHKLEIRQIIDEKGNLTDVCGEFSGKNARASRDAIIDKLEKKGLLKKIDHNYTHNLSVCYRCETPVEPLISKQWFIDVNKPVIAKGKKKKSIKEMAIEVVTSGQIVIVPERFNKIYFHWMENLRDWCISRQIWFGHRIPVYYCLKERGGCGKTIVSRDKPLACDACKNSRLKQDPDTLDTWFSSGLWTFSTLGWPEETQDLAYFHPTAVLETGYDILFFWVARMIIMTTYLTGTAPFQTVYLHGLVRDKDGRKMSKSLGNGIDPLDMIEKYGADAVRLSLVVGATPGNDIRLYEEKIGGYRNFVNKIWNASRYAILNIKDEDFGKTIDLKSLSIADKWILSKVQKLIKKITDNFEQFSYSEAGNSLYDFIWREFCDWYLEISKVSLNTTVLECVLESILKLLHPFTPFMTETIWDHFLMKRTLLIGEKWPTIKHEFLFEKEEADFEILKDVIMAIRSIRSEYKVDPGKKINVIIISKKYHLLFEQNKHIIMKLGCIDELILAIKAIELPKSAAKVVHGTLINLPLASLIDLDVEKNRLEKAIRTEEEVINFLENKLDNKLFIRQAPKEVVHREKERLEKAKDTLEKLEEQLKRLQN